MPSDVFADIPIAGGDTATPLSLSKRLDIMLPYLLDRPGSRFIDCGCGAGEYVMCLHQKHDVDAWGVEYLAEKIDTFRRLYRDSQRVSRGDIQTLAFAEATFDVALLNEVLEHVPHPEVALSEVRRVLRDDGRLIILSPNRLYPFETHGVYIGDSDRLLPPYVPLIPYVPLPLGRRWFRYWARNYWPWQLRRLVREAGFEIVRTEYLWQTFENISGTQPALVRSLRPLLRRIVGISEKVPGIRAFGVSQVIVASKQ